MPDKFRSALSDLITPCTGYVWSPMTQDKQMMHAMRDIPAEDVMYLDFNLNQDNV